MREAHLAPLSAMANEPEDVKKIPKLDFERIVKPPKRAKKGKRAQGLRDRNMRKKHSGHTFTCVVCHKKCLCGIKKKDHVGRHRAHPSLPDHRWGLHYGRKRKASGHVRRSSKNIV
jgi:hypothetical protein